MLSLEIPVSTTSSNVIVNKLHLNGLKIYWAVYYHFRSTLKRDDFFAYVYVLNLTVLSGYVSL